jgi:hypothetical protein
VRAVSRQHSAPNSGVAAVLAAVRSGATAPLLPLPLGAVRTAGVFMGLAGIAGTAVAPLPLDEPPSLEDRQITLNQRQVRVSYCAVCTVVLRCLKMRVQALMDKLSRGGIKSSRCVLLRYALSVRVLV